MKKFRRIIKKIVALFYKDLHWKLLSLALALALWLVGINLNNPLQNFSYEGRLNILGREQLQRENIVLLNERELQNTSIEVSVRATRTDHTILSARADNVQGSINLSGINFDVVRDSQEPVYVPIDVDAFVLGNYSSRTLRPSTVMLRLDNYGTRTVPITLDLTGTPRQGFQAQEATSAHTLALLTGARSALDLVETVRLRLDIHDAYETVERVERLVVYDENMEDITELVNLNVRESHVTVRIQPIARKSLAVSTIGTERLGFTLTDVLISPSAVEVVGAQEVLEATYRIQLGTLPIENADDNIVQTFDIRQALEGTGLTLREGAPAEAAVTAVIEQVVSRDFYILSDEISVYGTEHNFTLDPAPISFSIRGRESLINAITGLEAGIDLTSLGAGTHIVPLVLDLPRGALVPLPPSVAVTIEINQEINAVPPEPEPEPQEELELPPEEELDE